MKTLAALLLLTTSAFAEKMHVKVIRHDVDDKPSTQSSQGVASGNASTYVSSSTSSIFMPAHVADESITAITRTMLLPDGRKVAVGCQDHLSGLRKKHNCKNPWTENLEAQFEGEKVKLSWLAELGTNKKESETYTFLGVIADQ